LKARTQKKDGEVISTYIGGSSVMVSEGVIYVDWMADNSFQLNLWGRPLSGVVSLINSVAILKLQSSDIGLSSQLDIVVRFSQYLWKNFKYYKRRLCTHEENFCAHIVLWGSILIDPTNSSQSDSLQVESPYIVKQSD
jgi:hypothetical protein